jgi:hypothetical protein
MAVNVLAEITADNTTDPCIRVEAAQAIIALSAFGKPSPATGMDMYDLKTD